MITVRTIRGNPINAVITGASRVDQVRENMGALDVVEALTPGVLEKIDAVLGNKPVEEDD